MRLGPRTATTAIASSRPGNASRMSHHPADDFVDDARRSSRRSIRAACRRVAEIADDDDARRAARCARRPARARGCRAPARRARTSATADGPSRRSGEILERRIDAGDRRTDNRREHGDAARWPHRFSSLIADPRIEDAVGEIGQQVDARRRSPQSAGCSPARADSRETRSTESAGGRCRATRRSSR